MKRFVLLFVFALAMSLVLAGCGKETVSIEPEMFACSDVIAGDALRVSHIRVDDTRWGSAVEGEAYSNFRVQVDDRDGIVLGQTSIKEIVDMFCPESEENLENAPQSGEYSFKVLIGDTNKGIDYQPIRLIDSEYQSKVTLVLYKYGSPYAAFSCYGGYAVNKGIIEEQDFIISGIEAAETKAVNFADASGRNYYAKQNCWISGGYRLTGEGFTYANIQDMLQSMGLEKVSGFSSSEFENAFIVYTNGSDVFIQAKMRCSGIVDSNEKFYIPLTTIIFTVDDETQLCTNISVNMNSGLLTYDYRYYDAEIS